MECEDTETVTTRDPGLMEVESFEVKREALGRESPLMKRHFGMIYSCRILVYGMEKKFFLET